MAELAIRENGSTSIESLFDQMFSDFPSFFESPFVARTVRGLPSLDLYEKEGQYIAELAVPGYEPKEIDVEVNGNVLTITGSHSETKEKREAKYHRREIRHGSFTRSVSLPQDVSPDNVSAKIEKGILKVTMTPMKPIASKKIEVKEA